MKHAPIPKIMSILIVLCVVITLCLTTIPYANATEASPELTAEQTESGVIATVRGAQFVKQDNGSVAIISNEGALLDTLPAAYENKSIEYEIYRDNSLLARRGGAEGRIFYARRGPAFRSFDWGAYAGCIAKTSLGAGATAGISTIFTGTGAAAATAGGLIGGLVWGPIGCYRR